MVSYKLQARARFLLRCRFSQVVCFRMQQKERELVEMMIKFLRGVRVGRDLELAELAVREERAMRERLGAMPAATSNLQQETAAA